LEKVYSANLQKSSILNQYEYSKNYLQNSEGQQNLPDFNTVNTVYMKIHSTTKKSISNLTISDYAQTVFNEGKINMLQLEYLYKLDNIVNQYTGTNEFDIIISKFDIDLQNEKLLTENEKNVIFVTSAVAEYSNKYWSENTTSKLKNTKSFWSIVGADAGGALVGALAGGLALPSAVFFSLFAASVE